MGTLKESVFCGLLLVTASLFLETPETTPFDQHDGDQRKQRAGRNGHDFLGHVKPFNSFCMCVGFLYFCLLPPVQKLTWPVFFAAMVLQRLPRRCNPSALWGLHSLRAEGAAVTSVPLAVA